MTDDDAQEEIVIRCKEITPRIIRFQQLLSEKLSDTRQLCFFKGSTEYYIDAEQILFFETDGSSVTAHSTKEVFETRMKLYELETVLGNGFMRISKSAIVNLRKIYSISRNVTASSAIEFAGTHKQVYVSRAYYKILKERLEEMRFIK